MGEIKGTRSASALLVSFSCTGLSFNKVIDRNSAGERFISNICSMKTEAFNSAGISRPGWGGLIPFPPGMDSSRDLC